MEPISLTVVVIGKLLMAHLGITALGATIIIAAVVILLTMLYIISWFRSKQAIANRPNKVSFTLKLEERLKSGEYALVQGVYDENTRNLVEARCIPYHSLDSELREKHRHHDLVVYR